MLSNKQVPHEKSVDAVNAAGVRTANGWHSARLALLILSVLSLSGCMTPWSIRQSVPSNWGGTPICALSLPTHPTLNDAPAK